MSRKPFIEPRAVAFDKRTSPGCRTAEVGAGDQCLILTVAPLHQTPPRFEHEKVGALVDLSFAETDQPFEVRVKLDHVRVPGHYFDHQVVERGGMPLLPTAHQCAQFVGEFRRLAATDDLDAEVVIEMLLEQLDEMNITP